MSREENIEIFHDTEKLCRTNSVLMKAWKESSAKQKLILEAEQIDHETGRYENPALIKVSKKRTFEAAMGYEGKKVVVLNFASASNPGGGVVNGSSAQEECLCRCSTLYYNLTEDFMWKNFYQPHRREGNPIHNDDLIYTPDVVIFKTDTAYPQLMPESSWKKVNVITCAAPNLRECPSNSYNSGDGNKAISVSDEELEAIHIKRGRKILEAAAANKNEVVVLGAFGCGAFMNKPEVVVRAYAKLIDEFKNTFETIEFAVYCSPRDESNFKVFDKVLTPLSSN
ncbi:MAG: TIGR02452 family protein [Treponema sp.]|nr:TIGR02452 family protein [Candidatus Treponema equifaecale]